MSVNGLSLFVSIVTARMFKNEALLLSIKSDRQLNVLSKEFPLFIWERNML